MLFFTSWMCFFCPSSLHPWSPSRRNPSPQRGEDTMRDKTKGLRKGIPTTSSQHTKAQYTPNISGEEKVGETKNSERKEDRVEMKAREMTVRTVVWENSTRTVLGKKKREARGVNDKNDNELLLRSIGRASSQGDRTVPLTGKVRRHTEVVPFYSMYRISNVCSMVFSSCVYVVYCVRVWRRKTTAKMKESGDFYSFCPPIPCLFIELFSAPNYEKAKKKERGK